jgi:hypothetical protein
VFSAGDVPVAGGVDGIGLQRSPYCTPRGQLKPRSA